MAKADDPLAALLAVAQKKYNLTVGSMSDIVDDVQAISTGNLAIDYSIGVGGVPMGRSLELYGMPSCGKTTTALQVAAELQKIIKTGGDETRGITPTDKILYLDYEQSMDPEYAKALGLDTEHESFLITQPDTLEAGADFTLAAVRTGRIRLVIFDSVAAMNPSATAEAESIGKAMAFTQAKLMKPFGVTLNTALAENNCTAIFLNHAVEKMAMGGRPGMPPTISTPGGIALKYFCSVRIEYRKIRDNKEKVIDPLSQEEVERPASTDVRVKVVKNKVAPPYREAVVRVRFGRGFDNFWTAMQVLIANKKVMYSTGFYYFHNVESLGLVPDWMERAATGQQRPYIRGEVNVFEAADKDPEWRDAMILLAEQIVQDNASALSRVVPVGDAVAEVEESSV